MNVFEDLIEELREENLLEETVVEKNKNSNAVDDRFNDPPKTATFDKDAVSGVVCVQSDVIEIDADSVVEYAQQNEQFNFPADSPETTQKIYPDENVTNKTPELNASSTNEPLQGEFKQEEPKKPVRNISQAEFFRNRATNEVLALQMVEHVFAGVEREVLNNAPKFYDELPVKKALHDFLQISANSHSPEHAQLEFQLMQETESWYSALTQRDKNIKVGHLRRYCENSRPALSSQALASLARFYRNAPYSETVRSKFDLILTRLFSIEAGKSKRTLMFSRDELIERIGDLYAEWSSVPLYSAEEDDSGIVLAALKMEDFMAEAEGADSFEELVENDFFNRLRVFKESTQENFFAPLLAASAVEANIRIGNRYAELFEKLQENADLEMLEEKYGFLHEQTISEAVCKTFVIKDFLNKKTTAPAEPQPKKIAPSQTEPAKTETPSAETAPEKKNKRERQLFKVNKWILALTIITILGTFGLYFWVEAVSNEADLSNNVKNVNLDNSSLKEHIQIARLSGDTFYGIVLPSWDGLTREKKEEFLTKVLLIGNEKGFVRVNLIDRQGKTVGYASREKVEVSNP